MYRNWRVSQPLARACGRSSSTPKQELMLRCPHIVEVDVQVVVRASQDLPFKDLMGEETKEHHFRPFRELPMPHFSSGKLFR